MSRNRIFRNYVTDAERPHASPCAAPAQMDLLTVASTGESPSAFPERTTSMESPTESSIGIARSSDHDYESLLEKFPEPAPRRAQFEADPTVSMSTRPVGSSPDAPSSAPAEDLHSQSLFSDTTASESLDLKPLSISTAQPRSTCSPSMTTMTSYSRDARGSTTSDGAKMPEFFSYAVFQTALCNPTIAHQLLKFSEARMCGENMEFLARVSRYQLLLNEVSQSIAGIQRDFLTPHSPQQVNLSEQLQTRINFEVKRSLATTVPAVEALFNNPQSEIEQLVYTDVYPRFVRHQMSVSAAKALSGNRKAYAGLGDCFVLTDPTKADNPIVYASDGFVMVTGYSRTEIIPRNCRFLQGRQTDRLAVARLKAAIDRREECVELLLNHKKTGEPFWNLLYVTPLFDGNGNLVFFLGGQINCSTTIHSASDVLRILGQPSYPQPNPSSSTAAPASPSPRKGFLSAFRSKSNVKLQTGSPGMENDLLDRIGDKDLKAQMKSFYTAYSNFIIINYTTFLIAFVSSGIADMLFPIKTKNYHAQGAGAEIFKFLSSHSSGSLSWDFKSSVKDALRAGRAISLEMKLCAKPYMGFETFVLHWTPLKDEDGTVKWVVLTLGSDKRI